MQREILVEDDASTIWIITEDHGDIWYEVKCGLHKIKQFTSEQEAIDHYKIYAPGAAKWAELSERRF